MSDTPVKSRRFPLSFRLRTLFVVVTCLAIWLGYQVDWMRQRRAFIAVERQRFLAMGFDVSFSSTRNQTRAPGGIWILGERGFRKLPILVRPSLREQDTERAQRLFPESTIMVMGEEPDPAQD